MSADEKNAQAMTLMKQAPHMLDVLMAIGVALRAALAIIDDAVAKAKGERP